MSKLLSDYKATLAKVDKAKAPQTPPKSKEERLAYVKLRREATAHGVKLENGGRGGLPSSLVLKVFRRDGYQCKVHGDHGEGENGGLTIHHIAGILSSEKQDKIGHANVSKNLVVLCHRAHDELHEKAKSEGIDSSQITPEGDYGTWRDKGDRGAKGLPWREE